MYFVIISIIGLLGIFLYMFQLAHQNKVVEKEIYFQDLPSAFDGVRLFFISDIHFRVIHSDILERIKGNVDLIIIGGDLMEQKVPFRRVEDNIRKLRAIAPTVFVWGNNDYEADYRRLDALLTENRVRILANEVLVFEQQGERLYIIGVDDVGKERDNLPLTLQDCTEEGFKIVVSHYPEISEKIKVDDKIGLVLSGHTHGGQIRLFGYGIKELGSYQKKVTHSQLISNGYGTTGVPLRLGAPPETHLLTLKTTEKTL